MNIPKPISKLIDHFQRLPGIGPKTAQRLTFQLLHYPQEELKGFAGALTGLKENTRLCAECKNVTEFEVCEVCDDPARDKKQIAIVATPMDVLALEKTGYKGVYHVLHGIIDPLNNVGPDEIFIKDLLTRVEKLVLASEPVEIIMATNTSMEGESTAMYILRLLRDAGFANETVKVTRIARGLPVGGDLEYADDVTLSRAMEGRHDF